MPCLKPIIGIKPRPGEQVKFKEFGNNERLKQYLDLHYLNMFGVPCRKCIGCRTDNAREWAIRSSYECRYSDHNYFITLTYSNDNVPFNNLGFKSVWYADVKIFINSLRKHFERLGHKNIKYLAASEYGGKTKRPHYHICFFNLPLNDLVDTGEKNEIQQPYFISPLIDKLWQKGIHKIGYVTFESAGYTARYTLKKLSKVDYEKIKVMPEKLYMSKGIGKKYFDEHWQEIYKYDTVYLQTNKGMIKTQPPRYYDRLLEKKDPILLEQIKAIRVSRAIEKLKNDMLNSPCSFSQKLGNKQREIFNNMKSLKRKTD